MRQLEKIAALFLLVLLINPAHAQQYGGEPFTQLLWSEGAPEAVGTADADKPMLTAYLPAERNATGTAVVVCPGGGYAHLAMDHEGHEVAEWLNTLGVAAFILKYRLGMRYHYPAPLQDVQRAIRTVRANAGQWGIDTERIGVLGFSAGGHLASTAATHFDAQVYEPRESVDEVSARPDFATLIYPVISMTAAYGHQGSKRHLLGEDPPPDLAEQLSSERQVTPETPPTFLVHASDDPVSVRNSINYYMALKENGVPAEMHVYESGGHGYGLAPHEASLSSWSDRWEGWMRTRGMLAGED
jgi:acetyl esterase/lipase